LDAPLDDEELFGKKKDDKPLYKLKMFQSVGSKIAESIKQFKTYHPYKKREKSSDNGIDNVINKVQEEIKQKEKENNEVKNLEQNIPVPA
jgi:membrane-anchored protein YejM (alkaline phosphatase superfamily)